MFMIFEPNINVVDELAALLADSDAFTARDTAQTAESPVANFDVVAPLADLAPVVDPMTLDDGSVFVDLAVPVVPDAGVTSSPVDVSTAVIGSSDAAPSDLSPTFDVDAMLLAGDFAFDLEALILAVGQNLQSLSFSPYQ